MDYIGVEKNEKFSTQCFMLRAIIIERLLLLLGCVYKYCIYLWLDFKLYILYFEGDGGVPVTGGHGWRPLVDRAAAGNSNILDSTGSNIRERR